MAISQADLPLVAFASYSTALVRYIRKAYMPLPYVRTKVSFCLFGARENRLKGTRGCMCIT